MSDSVILALNCGSSSIKFAVFDASTQPLPRTPLWGGKVQGIASGFSTLDAVDDIPIYSLFTPEDIPGYATYSPKDCAMCAQGLKIDALSNSYGLSRL